MRNIVMVIGALIALFGLSSVGASFFLPINTNGTWLLQVIGTILGGGLTSFAGYKFLPASGSTSVVDLKVGDIPTVDALQSKDFECMNHLAERFRVERDVDGLNLCRQIDDRIFAIHHKMPVVVDEVKDVK